MVDYCAFLEFLRHGGKEQYQGTGNDPHNVNSAAPLTSYRRRSHPIAAIVISCQACGLLRIAENYPGAHARASAHIHVAGDHAVEYTAIDSADRLRLAQVFAERSRRTVEGYVEDEMHVAVEVVAV